MKKYILTTVIFSLITLLGFSQNDTYVLGGGINKSFDGNDSIMFYKVRNNGTTKPAYLLIHGTDTLGLILNGDTIYTQKPDTSSPIFNLIEGDLLVRDNIKTFNHTSRAWEGLSGGGNTLDQAYDEGGAGAGREIEANDGAVYISGEDGFIVTGTFGSGDTSQWVGAGTGMLFNPRKAAFRAGKVENDEWNETNVGDYSFVIGNNSIASGEGSISMGLESFSTGDISLAIGEGVVSSGYLSSAFGEYTEASGDASVSMGTNSVASGYTSFSIGINSIASGGSSFSSGNSNTSKSFSETAMGLYNSDYTPISIDGWQATDRLFVIGNGQSDGNRSDALVILKNGNTGFGTSTPDTTLHLVGKIKYVDGTEGTGKVLTSDANGVATWEGLAGGDIWTNSGNYIYAQTLTDSVGIGTSTPKERLEVEGGAHIHQGDSAGIRIGKHPAVLLGGAITSIVDGTTMYKKDGDWEYLVTSSRNNLSGGITSGSQAINKLTGDINQITTDKSRVFMQSGNITGTPNTFTTDPSGVEINLYDNSGAKFTIADNASDKVLEVKKDTLLFGSSSNSVKVRYVDGSQGIGKLLTSDADGYATWKPFDHPPSTQWDDTVRSESGIDILAIYDQSEEDLIFKQEVIVDNPFSVTGSSQLNRTEFVGLTRLANLSDTDIGFLTVNTGDLVYNTDRSRFEAYDGANWNPFASNNTESFAATNGGTSSAADETNTARLSPTGTIATHTLNFPDNPVDGQVFRVVSNGQTITDLTLATTAAGGIIGGITSLTGIGASYVYMSSGDQWCRF